MALNTNFDVLELIKTSINRRVAEIADEEFAEALKRIESRKPEAITGVVLDIEKYLTYERIGPTIRIELRERQTQK